MTPEAAGYLEKAQQLLGQAETILTVHLNDAAGRAAYLAAFHAAQALIFQRTGKVLKSHKGVHTEFLRLTKDDRRVEPELRAFLSQAYNLKTIADYEVGAGSEVSIERATAAVDLAKRFVARVAGLVAAASS